MRNIPIHQIEALSSKKDAHNPPERKPPDMREPSHSPSRSTDRTDTTEDLKHEPEPKHQPRRNCRHAPETEEVGDQCVHPVMREEGKVHTEYSRDRAGSTEHRDIGSRKLRQLRENRGEPCDKLESEKPCVSQSAFNVIAEDPQVPHVESDMRDATVQEHRCEEGNRIQDRWNKCPCLNECIEIRRQEFDNEHEDIDANQADRHDRESLGAFVVAERKHKRMLKRERIVMV